MQLKKNQSWINGFKKLKSSPDIFNINFLYKGNIKQNDQSQETSKKIEGCCTKWYSSLNSKATEMKHAINLLNLKMTISNINHNSSKQI